MVTMTMHVEEAFAEALRARAAEMGKSVNQTFKDVLAPFLGLVEHREDANPWMKLCGSIPKSEAKAMRAALAEQDVVDEELWR